MALTGASAGLIALGLGRIRARDPDAAPAAPVATPRVLEGMEA